ncbi:MAG: cytidylate kinase-like family protein [Myxococcota bacterium]|nr:cytidylate kinase-like family protein [Myxococcota bacterium]
MSVILISADDEQTGEEVAEKTAKALGYNHLGPGFLSTIAERYNVKEDKLMRALNRPPKTRLLPGKGLHQHLNQIRAAVLDRLLEDGIVSQGLAAHFYVKGISHALTVRLTADRDARIKRVMEVQNLSDKKAARTIDRLDTDRDKWSQKAFGYRDADPALYDMVLNLNTIALPKAAEVIADMAQYRKFKPMTYSVSCLKDLALAAEFQVALQDKFPDVVVSTEQGTAKVYVKCTKRQKVKTAAEIKVIANTIPQIKFVEVHAVGANAQPQQATEAQGDVNVR